MRGINELNKFYNKQDDHLRFEESRSNKLEYLTTIKYLDKLGVSGKNVLDACAGTGTYSFYLANKGAIVTAGDIVPNNIDSIRRSNRGKNLLKESYTGSTLDLSRFEDNSFDIVLCLGAFYHLHDKGDREKAIKEAYRVLKQNGIMVISYLNRYASFIDNLNSNSAPIDILMKQFDSGIKNIFYRASPNEVEAITASFNIEKLHNISTDGISYMIKDKLEEVSIDDYNRYLEYHYKTCEEESILGYSLHGLYIGKKL